ncbi:hypothetical protein RND71_034511 [Anisodus tanguticus]|uniref:Uncharacterized protein n=1 Tax=Anisodus tanguticus TaxID=243964 RepID=A0AAE1UYG1_9SOLA|nr:hypothetical protein RND71_034511 [Anisodus tanguticus]
MNPNQDDPIRIALYESLGFKSEDILINEDHRINTNLIDSHNDGKDTHMSGEADTYAYSGECGEAEEMEEVYSDEQILSDPISEVQSSGLENMGCTSKDCRTYVEQQRSKMMMKYHKMDEEEETEVQGDDGVVRQE